MRGIPIGQLLVEQGVLTVAQVDNILRVQKESARPFGDLAERLYGIDPQAVEDAWARQYIRTAGVVDIDRQAVDPDCVALLTQRQAWQFHVMPINREGEHLNVVTCAERLIRAVNFTSRTLKEPVYFVIAERQQLRHYLMRYFPVPEYIAQYAGTM